MEQSSKNKKIRLQRVAVQLRKELGNIIERELKNSALSKLLGTVTEVSLSDDFSYARVYVSVYGSKKEKMLYISSLNRASGIIRKKIGQKIRLRRTPELHFELDESIEKGARILKLLSEHKDDDST